MVEEHKPGLHYWAWRRPLRRGLYMVKSKTLYEGASPQQLLPFTFDMDFRKTWDENMNCQLPIPPPSACPPAARWVAGLFVVQPTWRLVACVRPCLPTELVAL